MIAWARETQSSDSKQKFAFDLCLRFAYYGIERSRYPCHICDTKHIVKKYV